MVFSLFGRLTIGHVSRWPAGSQPATLASVNTGAVTVLSASRGLFVLFISLVFSATTGPASG